MSLTSVLSCPSHQQLRNKFKSEFPKPAIDRSRPLKAPPLTKHYGEVGTAFDYLVRFHLESIKEGCIIYQNEWVCSIALKRLLRRLQKMEEEIFIYKRTEMGTFECKLKDLTSGSLEFYRSIGYVVIEKEHLLQTLQKTYLQGRKIYQQFLKTKRVSDKLVKSTLFFARLDIYLRAGIFDFDIWDQYDDADVQDLKRLFALLRQQSFTYQKHCYLNPTFGLGSNMVGGADADVIIDHTLLEIKVTKNLELERSQFNQLIGYYFLSQIGGVNNKARLKPIKRIGIYFARHGYLWTIPISDLCSITKRKEFKTWLYEYFCAQNKEKLAELEKQSRKLKLPARKK